MDRFERVEAVKRTKLFHVLDLAVLGAVILASLLLLLLLPGGAGERVEIYQNGKLKYSLPLGVDRVIEISEDGRENVISVHGGKVSVTGSNCAGKDCVRAGEISRAGQSLVCLPHRLTVKIVGKSGMDGEV